jgi:hypothetical protein
MTPPRIHHEAQRLVRERRAPDYSAACRMIAARRHKPKQPVTANAREIRLPYRDD